MAQIILVKTRNIGDQVLLRHQADYLARALPPGFNIHVVASHADVFKNRKYQVTGVNRRNPQGSNWALFKELLFAPRCAIYVFYSTNRNRVILGFLCKIIRALFLRHTRILSYKSDFQGPNTYSELSLKTARGYHQHALFRDFTLTLLVEKIATRIARTGTFWIGPRARREIQTQFEAEVKTLKADHFSVFEKLNAGSSFMPLKGSVFLSLGASQEPRMIDFEMCMTLIDLLGRFKKRVVLHRAPVQSSHEKQIFEQIQGHPKIKELVTNGRLEVFTNVTIQEFEDKVLKCELFIGSDSGPKHLAAAVGIPTLCFDYSGSMKDWHFYALKDHLVIRKKVPCRPNYSESHGYEWCGLSFCSHLSCHSLDRGALERQLAVFFEKGCFDVPQALIDFPELNSFYRSTPEIKS